jgi:tetratricopeptide (TPR) repeat protein
MEQANTHLSKHDYAEALPFLKQAVKGDLANTEAIFKRATCYVRLGQCKMAIPDLLSLSRDYPLYDVQVYTMLGASLAASSDFKAAVKHVSRGIAKFPSSLSLYLTRGKLLLLDSKCKAALRDFKKVLETDQEQGEAWQGIGDCFVTFGKLTQAAQVYKKALNIGCISACLRRAELFYREQHYPRALTEVNTYLAAQPNDPAALLLLAKILTVMDQVSEATLCLEQAIKFDVSQEHSTTAILMLGQFRLKQHDYYGALHTLQRAEGNSSQDINTLMAFTDGVMGLVRRNFAQSIETFTKLIKDSPSTLKPFMYDCYANRAFANASCMQILRSLNDVVKCCQAQPLDKVARYNAAILKGFISAKDKQTEAALMHFEDAAEVYPNNAEPQWYIGLVTALKDDFVTAKECLDRAVALKDQDCDILFSRALLHYLLDDPVEAIKDTEAAIDKSDDNEAAHYLLKGLCFGRLKLYREAREEFSVSLQLTSNDPQVLFYRGRCSFLMHDTKKAFEDFQVSLNARPQDPQAHSEVGDLLMSAGAYLQAIKAYEASILLKSNIVLERRRALCSFALMDWETAAIELQRLGPDAETQYDLSVLSLIMRALESQKWEGCVGECTKLLVHAPVKSMFVSRHIRWLKGVVFVLLNSLSKATTELQLAYESAKGEEKGALMYNFGVVSLVKEQYDQALAYFIESFSYAEVRAQGLLLLLVAITALQLDQSQEANEYMTEAFRMSPQVVDKFLETKYLEAAPFQKSRGCLDKLPGISIMLKGATLVRSIQKLSLALPNPQPAVPPLEFQVEKSIKSYFSFSTSKCKLEAPWLNRINGAVQFTDNLLDYPSLTVTTSSKASLDMRQSSEYKARSPTFSADDHAHHTTPEEVLSKISAS